MPARLKRWILIWTPLTWITLALITYPKDTNFSDGVGAVVKGFFSPSVGKYPAWLALSLALCLLIPGIGGLILRKSKSYVPHLLTAAGAVCVVWALAEGGMLRGDHTFSLTGRSGYYSWLFQTIVVVLSAAAVWAWGSASPERAELTVWNTRQVWKLYRANWQGMLGLYIMVAFVAVALLAPVLANHSMLDPTAQVGYNFETPKLTWGNAGIVNGLMVAMVLLSLTVVMTLPHVPGEPSRGGRLALLFSWPVLGGLLLFLAWTVGLGDWLGRAEWLVGFTILVGWFLCFPFYLLAVGLKHYSLVRVPAKVLLWIAVAMPVLLVVYLLYVNRGTYYLWLGTDEQGLSVWAEFVWSARISLVVGILATIISSVLGAVIGVVAGYFGGAIGEVGMRFTDVFLVIPWLPLAMVLAAWLGSNYWIIIIIIGVTSWPGTARVVRSDAMRVRELQFIERARAIGSGSWHIMNRHIMPNVFPLIFANTVLVVAIAILSETELSFLGLGDPLNFSWGTMLHNAWNAGASGLPAWWYILPPGVAIVLIVLAFTFIGTAFDEVLDPKLRKREESGGRPDDMLKPEQQVALAPGGAWGGMSTIDAITDAHLRGEDDPRQGGRS